jgi:hypothetical protein
MAALDSLDNEFHQLDEEFRDVFDDSAAVSD